MLSGPFCVVFQHSSFMTATIGYLNMKKKRTNQLYYYLSLQKAKI